jgi:hypothetical protein
MSTSPTTGIPPLLLAEIQSLRRRRRRLERAGIVLKIAAFSTAGVAAALFLDWKFEWAELSSRLVGPCAVTGLALFLTWALSRQAHLQRVRAQEAREIDLLLPPLQEGARAGAAPFSETGTPLQPGVSGAPSPSVPAGSPLDETLMLRNRLHAEALFPRRQFHRAVWLFLATAAVSAVLALRFEGTLQPLLHRFLNPFARIPLTRILVDQLPKWVAPGTDVELNATVTGKLPGEALLRLKEGTGAAREVLLPLFGRRLVHNFPELSESVSFQIIAGRASSKWITITAVHPPKLEGLSLRVIPPLSSRQEAQVHTQWPPSLHAPAGSRIVLEFRTPQPVVTAFLERTENEKGQQLALLEPTPCHFRTTWEVLSPHSFSVELRNALGQANPRQSTTVFLTVPEAPRFKLLLPETDSHFPQSEDLVFEAELTRAESVERWGLTLQPGGGAAREVLLGTNKAEARTLRARHVAELSETSSPPPGTLTWFFWYEPAEQHGSPKRVEGELFFGTTAPPETSPAHPAASAAFEALLEIQKGALAATWNLRRKLHASPAASAALPPELLPELEAIQRSQKHVQWQTTQKLLQFDRKQARTDRLREAEAFLLAALSALQSTRQDASRLDAALTAGRAAYEALSGAGFQGGPENPEPER